MAAEYGNKALHCHSLLAHSTLLYACSSLMVPSVAWRTPEAPLRIWRMCFWCLKGLKSFLQCNDNKSVINYPVKRPAYVLLWMMVCSQSFLKGQFNWKIWIWSSFMNSLSLTFSCRTQKKILHCMETNARRLLKISVPHSYAVLAWHKGVNNDRIVIEWTIHFTSLTSTISSVDQFQ